MAEYSAQEVEAIQIVSELPTESRIRVIRKLSERLDGDSGRKTDADQSPNVPLYSEDQARFLTPEHHMTIEIREIFDRMPDLTKSERVLVAMALLKLRRGQNSFLTREVHCVLINAENRLNNIASFFDFLNQKRPALIMRVSGEGAGRVRYRMTDYGFRETCRLVQIKG